MNILHILSRFDSYDAIAGALDLSSHLAAKNFNSIIASSLDYQAVGLDKFDLEHHHLPKFETNIKNYITAYKSLKKIIRANKIDILHTYSARSNWLAFWAARHTGKPLVTTCYDFYPKKIANYSLGLSKKVIVHSEALAEHLINNFDLPRERLRFIKPSLNLENFNFRDVDHRSKTDFNIGIIAPSRMNKEYVHFLKAMVKVIRIIPPIKIWIIFYKSQLKGNTKEDLKVWTRRLGLINYVKFFEVSDLSLDFLSGLNLLIFSAFKESTTLRPILEAQSYGVPVIATRVGGVAEIVIDKITGILVLPHDNNSLAAAVIEMLKDFPQSRQIVTAARKRMEEEFSLSINEKAFISTYKEAKSKAKILAINTGRIQDVISSTPALRVIKEQMPGAQITSLVSPSLRSLLRRCPYVDEFIVYDRESQHKGLLGFVHIVKSLIRGRFDIVFDFNNSFLTHVLSYLSLANKRYGYSQNIISRFLVNNGVKPTKSTNLEKDKLTILRPLGVEAKDGKLELWPSQEDVEFADTFLKDNWVGREKIVGMDISTQKRLFNDSRALDYLAYLCDKLANQQIRVMLVCLKDDASTEAQKELSLRIKSKPILARGDIPTMQLACLIKKCDIYVSLNRESLYMALAMKTPSIIMAGDIDNFDFTKHKNIKVVPTRYFNKRSNFMNKRGRFRQAAYKDSVVETISGLMQAK
ncbi:glycosyltransferase [Candidatus Omnitrophota bacterium]